MSRSKHDVASELSEHLLLPLLVGGEVRLVPPIGAKRALELADGAMIVEGDTSEPIARARLHVARRLLPVDSLAELEPAEWLMLFALNDLLQVTNPDLGGLAGGERPKRLLGMVAQVIARAGAPATLGQAVARHATFSRVLELSRQDQHVSWWVGQSTFRGTRAPRRLLMWPRWRRVSSRSETLGILQMTPAEAGWAPLWRSTLAGFIALSPLSDLAALGRVAPAFEFTAPMVGLLATHAGFELAARAVERSNKLELAVENARAAASRLPDAAEQAVHTARLFVERLEHRRMLAG